MPGINTYCLSSHARSATSDGPSIQHGRRSSKPNTRTWFRLHYIIHRDHTDMPIRFGRTPVTGCADLSYRKLDGVASTCRSLSLVVTSSDCDSATRLRMRVGGVENGECLMLFVVCPQQVFVFMRSLLERGECKMTLSCPELLNGTRLLFELFRYVCWD